MSSRRRTSVLTGLGIGAIGVVLSLVPFALSLEENAELAWYFSLRGKVAAPPDVVVIGIEEQTADALGISDELDEWPRTVHAELVDKLAHAGASTIVFDISFAESRSSDDDRAFAEAIARAGNVVLLDYLESGVQSTGGTNSGAPQILTERRVPPISSLRDRAMATAPFPLPVVPVRVNQFWSFSPTLDHSPTLPVVALHIHVLPYYAEFLTLLDDVRPDLLSRSREGMKELIATTHLPDTILSVRALFRADPEISIDMRKALDDPEGLSNNPQARSALLALINVYQGGDSSYLNFYGPPRSITTLPYQNVLQSSPDDIDKLGVKDKVVFIGYSAKTMMGQRDDHYSVFSQDSGLNLGGTEIAATAFANLSQMKCIMPLGKGARLGFIFLWGIVLTVALCCLSTRLGFALAIACASSYLFLASYLFGSSAMWWPIIVPILIQLPIALYAADHLQLTEEKSKTEEVFNGVVADLPPKIANQLEHTVAGLVADTNVNGTCLFTDIKGYTAITEKFRREGQVSEGQHQLHQYRVLMLSEIARSGGFIDAFTGDACLGVWPNPQQRKAACEAVIRICKALEQFNRSDEHPEYITRLGVHFGQISIGKPGRAGQGTVISTDTLNIGARIEQANKVLQTRVLVSEPVLAGLEKDFVTRPLGTFFLRGVDQPLKLHELMTGSNIERSLLDEFAEGLMAFQKEDWGQALRLFERLRERFPDDGPTRFFLNISSGYEDNGPDDDWNGSALRLP